MFIFHYVSLQMHLHLFTFTHTYHCVAFSCTDFVLLHSVIAIYTADENNSNGSLNASSCKRCSDGWVTSLLRGRNLMLQVLHVVCCLLLPGTVEVQPDRGRRGSRQNFETAVLDRVTVERGEKTRRLTLTSGKCRTEFSDVSIFRGSVNSAIPELYVFVWRQHAALLSLFVLLSEVR